MISNNRSTKLSGLLKIAFAICCAFSLVLSACTGGPKPVPSTNPSPVTVSTSTPTPPEGLPTETLEPTVTEELLPTDNLGETVPTDETGLELLPTEELITQPVLSATAGTPAAPRTTLTFGVPTRQGLPNPLQGTKTVSTVRVTGSPRPGVGLTPQEVIPPLEATQPVQFNPTPAGVPIGDPSNPIILGIVGGTADGDTTRIDSSEQLASQLSETTGYTIQVQQVNSYIELLNGMQIGAIHMAWLQPFTYILASRRGYAKVALVTDHFGVYAYGTQFLANSQSGFTAYFNANTNKSTVDATEALPQFADKRPCWVDPLSASGYIAPDGLLADNNVATQGSVFLLSHTAVVRALYIQGICDFGATFGIYGDPRTASTIQQDLPDVMQKVVVIWQSGEIIPNLNLSFQSNVPDAISQKIASALNDMVLGEDGRQLISNANGYDIQDLKVVDDTFYDPLRKLVVASRVNLKTLVGK